MWMDDKSGLECPISLFGGKPLRRVYFSSRSNEARVLRKYHGVWEEIWGLFLLLVLAGKRDAGGGQILQPLDE